MGWGLGWGLGWGEQGLEGCEGRDGGMSTKMGSKCCEDKKLL